MTGRLWRRSGSAAAVVLAVLTLSPAPSAWAGAVITLDQPRADPPLDSSAVTISGSVVSDLPLLNVPRSVSLAMSGQQAPAVTCADSPCKFSWPLQLARNGPYDFTVSATDGGRLIGGDSPPAKQSGHFSVAAPPKKPVLDPPKVTDGRTVELTWSRNTEPDLLYYAVFRKDPAGTKFLQVGSKVSQPATGNPTFTDTTTTFLGGDFAYQVVAVRMGATGTAASEVSSAPSASGAATVPPPPTTTTVAPLPGTPGAGPTTTVKVGAANGVDLSGFLSSRAGQIAVPPITVPEPPDPGFQNTLPFGARPPGDDVEEGDAEPVPPTVHRSTTSIVTQGAGRPLVPIAGGLVLLLLAMHLRLLNRRIKPVTDGDLPLDPVVPPPAPAAARPDPVIVPEPLAPLEPLAAAAAPAPPPDPADPDPEPEPDAVTPLYDVLQDEAEWAPRDDLEGDELWAPELDLEPDLDVPPDFDDGFEFDLEPRPLPEEVEVPEEIDVPDENEIEVVDVVVPSPRRLVRSGSR